MKERLLLKPLLPPLLLPLPPLKGAGQDEGDAAYAACGLGEAKDVGAIGSHCLQAFRTRGRARGKGPHR